MKNIYQTITAIMEEVAPIGKDSVNQKQGFKYRSVDAVMNALQPLFAKHKLFCVPEVLDNTREERVSKQGGILIYSIIKTKYTFFAEDGTSVSAVVVGEGMDSADKASNKALAIAFKYVCFQLFCIPTEDTAPDPDADTHKLNTIKCDKCGAVIQEQEINGALRSAEEIKANCNGMCLKCYKETIPSKKEIKNETENQNKNEKLNNEELNEVEV